MKLEDIIHEAYTTDWVLSDEFRIEIDSDKNIIPQETWNMSTVSFSTPELSAPEGDTVIGGERRLTSRLYDLFRFNVVFRDIGRVNLRRYFEKKFALQQKLYPKDIETTISIYHVKGDLENGIMTKVFSTSALITNISGANYNNSESSIQEFTVSFSATKFDTEDLEGFGSSKFDNDVIDILSWDFLDQLK